MKGMYSKLSKSSEISRFENRFSENVIEIAAVTGALGIGASKAVTTFCGLRQLI